MKETRERHELKLERFLGRKPVVAAIMILEDILFFFIISYLANVVCNIGQLLKDPGHPGKYLGILNCLPDMERIREHSEVYLFLFALWFIFCIFIDIRQGYRMRAAFSSHGFNLNQKGYARWTTEEEIREQYIKIPDRDRGFPGYGGTIISRMGNSLFIDTDMVNNLIIGITRSGKGEMEVIPSIDVYSRAEKKTSLVVCDPKTELYKTSKKTLEERGYDVYLLSLVDPEHSMGFNPLGQIVELYVKGDFSNAELLAQTFSYSIFNPDKQTGGDTFWQDTPSSLLTALILAHVDDCYRLDQMEGTHEHIRKVNMYSIINTFGELVGKRDLEDPDVTALDSYFNNRPPLDRARMKYIGIEVAGYRTKGSIFASMFAKLTIFTYENIAKMTAESSLDLEEIGFGKRPVAVFLEIPDYDKSTHFLATVFLRQMYFVLARRATRNPSGKCDNRVRVIADEFGNLPAIEAMENIMTVCLGRNIAFDLYIQAYSQLTKLYGENAKTITGNCGNTIYILSDDDETTERFSKNLGNETVIDLQRNGQRLSTKKNITESSLEKPLLNMNQLEELKPGECVVKRVMKRTDRKGQRITPHPVFNSEENGRRFLFRYEYLKDTFPDPGDIDLREINTEDRSHINLQERVWDPWKSFELSDLRNRAAEDKTSFREEEKEPFMVIDLSNRETVMPAIEGELGKEIPLDMEIGQLKQELEESGLDGKKAGIFSDLLNIGMGKDGTKI